MQGQKGLLFNEEVVSDVFSLCRATRKNFIWGEITRRRDWAPVPNQTSSKLVFNSETRRSGLALLKLSLFILSDFGGCAHSILSDREEQERMSEVQAG